MLFRGADLPKQPQLPPASPELATGVAWGVPQPHRPPGRLCLARLCDLQSLARLCELGRGRGGGEPSPARRAPTQRTVRGRCSGRQAGQAGPGVPALSEISPESIAGWNPALPRPHSHPSSFRSASAGWVLLCSAHHPVGPVCSSNSHHRRTLEIVLQTGPASLGITSSRPAGLSSCSVRPSRAVKLLLSSNHV